MSYSVGSELQEYIAAKVRSGEYQNQSEVVRDALRKMKREDELHRLRLADLNDEIARGARQLEQGQRVSAEASRSRRQALFDENSEAAG